MIIMFIRLICRDSLCHTVIPDPHAAIEALKVSGHFVAAAVVVTIGKCQSAGLLETTAWRMAALGESTHAVLKAHTVFRRHLSSREVEHHRTAFLMSAFCAVL